MFGVTGGVNTHKGIIFSLAVLGGAYGGLYAHSADMPPLNQVLPAADCLAADADWRRGGRESAQACRDEARALYEAKPKRRDSEHHVFKYAAPALDEGICSSLRRHKNDDRRSVIRISGAF